MSVRSQDRWRAPTRTASMLRALEIRYVLFNRQKLLLALLESLGGDVGATDFQKHLFLFTRLYERERSFEFLPYRFGCYSFQAAADKTKLVSQGRLLDESNWQLADRALSYRQVLSKNEQTALNTYVEQHGGLSGKRLIRHVYTHYPYFATRSEIARKHLSDAEYKQVAAARPKKRRKSAFFTIGYEGQCIESYLNRLIENDVRLLVDVRKNPLSRKYGFSKGALSRLCDAFGIAYRHFPSLGIPGKQRQNLDTQDDYERLFERYEQDVLAQNAGSIQQLVELVGKHKRLAITCFEREHIQCHRDRVAKAVAAEAPTEVAFAHL